MKTHTNIKNNSIRYHSDFLPIDVEKYRAIMTCSNLETDVAAFFMQNSIYDLQAELTAREVSLDKINKHQKVIENYCELALISLTKSTYLEIGFDSSAYETGIDQFKLSSESSARCFRRYEKTVDKIVKLLKQSIKHE